MTQFGLFTAPVSLLSGERGEVTYYDGFLPAELADVSFATLRDGVDWHAQRRVMYEREVDVPRLTAHFALEDLRGDEVPAGIAPETAKVVCDAARRVTEALGGRLIGQRMEAGANPVVLLSGELTTQRVIAQSKDELTE